MRRAPTELAETTTYVAYNLKTLIQGQLQNFLMGLGYMGLGEATNYNALGSAVGLGVIAGLGEQSRLMHLMTPEYGARQRVYKLITDLPLATGKPIDFGVMRFCRVCRECAELCPVQAIPHDTDPGWDIRGPYQNPGVRIWRRNDSDLQCLHAPGGLSGGLCHMLCRLPPSVKGESPGLLP